MLAIDKLLTFTSWIIPYLKKNHSDTKYVDHFILSQKKGTFRNYSGIFDPPNWISQKAEEKFNPEGRCRINYKLIESFT